ncbi:hypothetical protein [Silvibacterium sp.]|uniref:hypothetical protein n=1 Tax=Silvibacterium sp. TaxID=1964179 RepID=UPI0039E4E9E8
MQYPQRVKYFSLPALASGLIRSIPMLFLASSGHAALAAISCTHAVIVFAAHANSVEARAIAVLREEEARRTGIEWPMQTHQGSDSVSIVVGVRSEVPASLSSPDRAAWLKTATPASAQKPEGFSIETLHAGSATTIVIAGNDPRGALFGVGYLLRKLEMDPGQAILPSDLHISTAPEYPVRGVQIGYRFKNNTYDAWTVAQFDQQTRDLAVFGNNTIQVVAPNSDDSATSPLYPAPALETLIGICKSTVAYGLNFDLYYPEMAKDYSDPAQVDAELKKADALFRAFPHIDALYIPGGDPGHTDPRYLLPLVEKEAVVLHKYHPKAEVWISAQGFSAAWFSEFYSILRTQHPAFLTGVFVGPQSRDSFPLQRKMIPARYRLQAYPDTAHTMHAQFALPAWDSAFALSEGREPIDPRPFGETEIYRTFAHLHSGFVVYSEGVNDDVNKILWDQLGWSSAADPAETLHDYSRYFLGAHIGALSSDAFAQGIISLEQNWNGPLLTHSSIDTTLLNFQTMENQASDAQRQNWRFEMALYRAYYDAYIRARLIDATDREQQAMAILRTAPRAGSEDVIGRARAVLQPSPVAADLHHEVESLADQLFHHVGMQLSVAKYGASGIERGANLDRVDVDLNNRAWLNQQFDRIEKLSTETDRQAALAGIVGYEDAGPGGFYDDLGNPSNEPHLVLSSNRTSAPDPQLYATTVNGIADKVPDEGFRISTLTYAETLYDKPLEMIYRDLDPHQHYRLRVTYGGEDYTLPIHLVANDTIEIHPPLHREKNPETLEFDVPQAATASGTLDLKWTRPAGIAGGGRGLQVAEVWLIPDNREAGVQ